MSNGKITADSDQGKGAGWIGTADDHGIHRGGPGDRIHDKPDGFSRKAEIYLS